MKVDFRYTGATSLNMTGYFSYDAATAGSHVKTELLSFNMAVFAKTAPTTALYGVTLSTLQSRVDNYFYFDADNEQFISTSALFQSWGEGSDKFATSAGRLPVIIGNGILRSITGLKDEVAADNFTTAMRLNVKQVTAVPEPEIYGLMLLGLGVMGAVVRRRQQA